MNNVFDFYDTLDLKYPEIGIAIQKIDRLKPGNVKLIIPVLTPNMDSSKIINQTIYLNKQNLKNKNTQTFEISNLTLTNYIEVPFPAEICMLSDIDEDNRYIASGSKWIIVFVGGDITKPRPIARYL